MSNSTIKNLIILFWTVFVVAVLTLLAWYYAGGKDQSVNSFEDCVAAGYPVMESYPRQCRAGNQTYVETIPTASPTADPVSYKDLIEVYNLKTGQKISNPLVITGRARGNWYFEASFPVRVLDSTGKELGIGVAQAQGDWMTTEYVPFSVTVNYSDPTSSAGMVEFVKDNPSGLPQHDDKYIIPVIFFVVPKAI